MYIYNANPGHTHWVWVTSKLVSGLLKGTIDPKDRRLSPLKNIL